MALLFMQVHAQEKWSHFTSKNGLESSETRVLLSSSDGSIWIGTLQGANQYKDGNFETKFKSEFVEDIVQDQTGDLWFAVSGMGVIQWDGTNTTNHNSSNGLTGAGEITSLFADSKQRIWASNWSKGVDMFDGKQWKNFNKSNSKLRSDVITDIVEDNNGDLWFGCEKAPAFNNLGGVVRYDGTTWTVYQASDDLVDDDVRCLYVDKKHNLWVGTSKGVSMFDGSQWTSYSTIGLLTDSRVMTITEDLRGRIWFGTLSGGVAVLDGNQWSEITADNGLVSNKVADIVRDKEGSMWFAYFDKGISKLESPDLHALSTVLPTEVRVYPIPQKQIISMEGVDADEVRALRLVSMNGQTCSFSIRSNDEINAMEVPVGDLPSGIYVVELVLSSGRHVTKILLE